MRTRWHNIAVLGFVLLAASCSQRAAQSGFRCIRADRRITGQSDYPTAVDPDLVGTYPADTKSGAGYFYDQVLEYRVWLHPDKGAVNVNGNKDYFVAFAQYEPAEVFSKATPGAEQPVVLVPSVPVSRRTRTRPLRSRKGPAHYRMASAVAARQ